MTFRSMEMNHYQLILPRQSAYTTMNLLGQDNFIHIVDSGKIADRPYHQMIKRCQQCLQRIQILLTSLKQHSIDFQQYDPNQSLFVERLHQIWKQQSIQLQVDEPKLFDIYENQINQQYMTYQDLKNRLQKLKSQRQDILQRIACMETISQFFGDGMQKRQSNDYYISNISQANNIKGVSYIVGIVDPKSEMRLAKMIYRVSRGYACTRTSSNFQYYPLRASDLKVMIVIYPSSDSSVMEKKIKKVIDTFCQKSYIMSQISGKNVEGIQKLKMQHDQVQNLVEMTNKEAETFFIKIKAIQYVQKWRIYMWKQKLLYDSLGKMQPRDQFYLGNLYIPTKKVAEVSLKLNKIVPAPSIHQIKLGKAPTAFQSTIYTTVPQQIVDTYGVPRYQQMNPAIFTTVTFPFFFGVMFGDIGHGSLLLGLGIYLIFNNQKIKASKMRMISQLRYMITMMGFFAVYCGFVYNDMIGFNLNLFGSCYHPQPPPAQDQDHIEYKLNPDPDCVYPFGIDPVWGRAQNQLNYVNSLKMKLSVIIAIIHMSLGVALKATNAIFYKNKLDFYFEFVPQFIFLAGLFGYMDFLIIFKWLQPWDVSPDPEVPAQQWAPSIISTMMNIGLKVGATSDKADGNSNMWGKPGNTSQDTFQLFLLIIAFICIPLMLLPKPIIQIKKMNKRKNMEPLMSEQDMHDHSSLKQKLNGHSQAQSSEVHEQQHDSSEIFVHQLIETIQFALGAVSNTASYLRLWALSLAHGQLSKVFYEYSIGLGIGKKGMEYVTMFGGFWMLCWITFGIIICMDSMQCFLHSLRLHWVEFQNKFYKGDGYKYQPFHFKSFIMDKKINENMI